MNQYRGVVARYFVATGPDEQQVGWALPNREWAERIAAEHFGQSVPVIEVRIVEWRRMDKARLALQQL